MELAQLLIEKIGSWFIVIFIGFALVKLGVIKASTSIIISKLIAYGVGPCVMIGSLQLECTPERVSAILLTFLASILVHVVYIPLGMAFRRPLRLNSIEESTLVFPNTGLVIPLAAYCFGTDWVYCTCGYLVIQVFIMWTYGRILISGEKKFEWKKILLNVNILAIVVGLTFFFTNVRLPFVLKDAFNDMTNCLAPLCMLLLGMLLADIRLKQLLQYRRTILICFLRLIIFPLPIIFVFAKTGLLTIHPQAQTILFIVLLQSTSPAASTIVQLSQIFDQDAAYAGILNIVTTLLCIITMPLIALIYQMVL